MKQWLKLVKRHWLPLSVIIVAYLISHLVSLTALPVFADEAIYIRWSQLIIDDWQRYLFFPLNDGKTPLQIWLNVPFQFLFSDQLFAGRFLVVLVGLIQVLVNGSITRSLGGRKPAIIFAMVFTAFLPFWYFHHRMALLDGLLTLFASLTVWTVINVTYTIKIQNIPKGNSILAVIKSLLDFNSFKKTWLWTIVAGVFLGLGLWSKIPVVLITPGLLLLIFLPRKSSWQKKLTTLVLISISTAIAITIFFSLKIHPAFSQLFSRGSDFLYPWQDVVFGGKWRHTLPSLPVYISYFFAYLSLPVMLLNLYGLFSKSKRTIHILFWSGIAFALPIAVLGIVVYPRYLFPAGFFFTIAAALAIQDYLQTHLKKNKKLITKSVAALILALLLANTAVTASEFIYYSVANPNALPLVAADKTQYLYEWSSGHGILESVEFIKNQAQDKRIGVATEGHFGTLPDGILMYLHRQNVSNIYVDGVGFPVLSIPEKFINNAASAEKVILVINSHRMKIATDNISLIEEHCRPDQAPCLQIWDITALIQQREVDNQSL